VAVAELPAAFGAGDQLLNIPSRLQQLLLREVGLLAALFGSDIREYAGNFRRVGRVFHC